MKISVENVISLFLFLFWNYISLADDTPTTITVAGFFKEPGSQAEVAFSSAIYTTNIMQQNVRYDSKLMMVSERDTFESTHALCQLMALDEGVGGIFTFADSKPASIIESVCSSKEIPIIQLDWRPSATYFSDYTTTIKFFPDQKLFFQGLNVIIESLHWRSFFVLYEKPESLVKLQNVFELQKFDKSNKYNSINFKELGSGPDYRPVLKQVQNSTEFHILLDCETENILEILKQGQELKLLEPYYHIFITSLDAHTVDWDSLKPQANITTIRIMNPESETFQRSLRNWQQFAAISMLGDADLDPYSIKTETALVHDATKMFIETVNALHVTGRINTKKMDCYDDEKWADGFRIAQFIMKKNETDGVTGPIEFDSFGRRKNFAIYVIEGYRSEIVASWNPDTPQSLRFARNESEMTAAWQRRWRERVWRVASILVSPYLMRRKHVEGLTFEGNNRYEGFVMDLIDKLSQEINFTYEFNVLPNTDRGNYDPKTKQWSGLVREILDRNADLGICDFTITPERREAVDFSTPFMRLGISILYKKADEKEADMYAFLDVFAVDVWIYTATLYLAMSVVIFFISRMSPTDWENPHPCEENPEELENIWNMKNCLWITLGGILNQGCDLLPKGLSTRMVAAMWWFFAIIVTNSYMANLASFLVNERKDDSLNSVEELAQQTKVKYGTLAKGSTQTFFETSNYSVYQRMWTNMQQSKPTVFEKENKDGVARVQNTKHRLYAFLMESSSLEYELVTKCDLEQIGKWLDSKGYGIAMANDFPFRSRINEVILNLQEQGYIKDLKTKWWKEKRNQSEVCPTDSLEEDSNKLALKNVGGVFFVLGVGIALAYITAIAEFLWNVKNVSVEEHITFVQALKIEILFVFNFWVDRKRVKPKISEASSSRSGSEPKSIAHSIIHGGGSFLRLNILNKSGTPGSSQHQIDS